METRINYAAVGLFVLALAALWIAASIWLLFGNPSVAYNSFYTYMTESVSGLYEDSPVRYRGVEVGKVEDIALVTSEQVRLTLDISKGAPIKTDTKATLRSQGLTGFYYVELIGGSKEAPLLLEASEAEIPVIESVPSLFMRLDQAVTGLLDNLTRVSDRLSLLLSEDNLKALDATLTNIAQISDSVAQHSGDIEAIITDLNTLTSRLAGRAETINETIGDFAAAADNLAGFSAGLPEIRRQVESMAERLAEASKHIQELVQTSAPGVRRFSTTTLGNINEAVVELNATLESLQRLTRKLNAQPNLLIVGEPEREPGPGEGE